MNVLERLVSQARRRSPWLFHMNTGGCNGCDIELVACLTPRYDVEQLGIRLEGSPRHADILCVSGPVTRNTRAALETIYAQMFDPKVVVAIGSCPATCNAFAGSPVVEGPLENFLPVDVYVPGCPPRPDAIIEGIARAAALLQDGGRRKEDSVRPTIAAGSLSTGGGDEP
jgi:membrane-bound hydrogenase subunit mbhJ